VKKGNRFKKRSAKNGIKMPVQKGCSDESDYPGCQTTKRENRGLRDPLEPGVDAVFGLGVEVLTSGE